MIKRGKEGVGLPVKEFCELCGSKIMVDFVLGISKWLCERCYVRLSNK